MSPGAEHAAHYLARYAEPEARLGAAVERAYSAALVVPVCRESLGFLAGYQQALSDSAGRVLLVVVVNAAEGASAETHAENQRLLADLALGFPDRALLRVPGVSTEAWLARAEQYDLLWLDRASVGARLPRGEGVGMARKLGADLAAWLWSRGQLDCPQLGCGDADAVLPSDYFARLASDAAEPEWSTALIWPFQHEPGGDGAIDAATVLYEISLRYYVLGLSAAGSPYAYQSVGSSLSFDATAYASVRGVPKRAAAEDFYLLDKLAKVGPLRRAAGAPIRLRARASERVPFGTGRRTREIAECSAQGLGFELYSPELFRALEAVLVGLNAVADSAQPGALQSAVAERVPDLSNAVRSALERLKVFAALAAAVSQAPKGAVLRRRLHTWFDALRTLRFMHLLRDAGVPSLPWRDALLRAPFLRAPFADGPSPEAVCARLARAEALLPPRIGPTLF
ncbi:MAG TPA: hypothetical protein VNW92_05200 [Polyangiaceae bacterium]|nr:hypothetical protein [Polyangiaceae bacterium]